MNQGCSFANTHHFDKSPKRSRSVAALVRGLVLLAMLLPARPVHAQQPGAQAEALLASMTVAERVGQLFLVTFVGNNLDPDGDIATLILQDRVGGVVLLAANSNFTNGPETPRQVAELTNALQSLSMSRGAPVPLFIGIDHEGDGYPYTRITGGTTPLPNAMAIGATWKTENARDIGQIVGLELAAMGVNLLLGPVVDVLDKPRSTGQGDIGTRTFGGDPWWVGQMGRAYIEGVHQGSGGRVATVAKHFPGHGGSDRLPDEEVATVDKLLEELAQVELAPFSAVTDLTGDEEGVTDALMSSHIRYRGIQGDVRQYTAPISFAPDGMGAILDMPAFSEWRVDGLMVSDSLGVPAVRKYFDPTLSTFPHRRIAKEAFLAGNDLLLLSEFDLDNVWAQQFRNIRDTIAFFREEYQSNPQFAARVDEAVIRILRLKLKLYPEFALAAVRVHPPAALQVCGLGLEVTQRIANQAITLLYPDANAQPAAPRRGEKMVIFTDSRPVRECFTEQCPTFSPLSQTAVEEAMVRIYGPAGTGQIGREDITSLPFGQLVKHLAGEETEQPIGPLLEEADWVLFAQQDLNLVKGPNSDAVKRFLNIGLSAVYDTRLVVLAFNAPYYLDTTEISKLDLYLVAYGKTDPFVMAAVRALFGEFVPRGASPVDVVGVNYSLQKQLSASPQQEIPLAFVEQPGGQPLTAPAHVPLRAGPILDRNGYRVADGTQVTFHAEYQDGAYLPPHAAETVDGMAETTFVVNEPGTVRFWVESGEARQSKAPSIVVNPAPTPSPGPTNTPSPTIATRTPVVPVSSPTLAPTATPTGPGSTPSEAGTDGGADGLDLALAVGVSLLIAWLALPLLESRRRTRTARVRCGLLAVCGGMVGYILYALGAIPPGSWAFWPQEGWMARVAVASLSGVGALLPLLIMAQKAGRPAKRVGS